MHKRSILISSLLGLALTAGCDGGPDQVVTFDARGGIRGVVYLDQNGNGLLDRDDKPFPSAEIRLLNPGTSVVVSRATADTTGVYRIRDIPVGRYQLSVSSPRLGDSLQVLPSLQEVSVVPQDSQVVTIGISHPKVSVAEARSLSAGKRVFVEGIVTALYGDTAHIVGASRAIRAARIVSASRLSAEELAGDSVRLLGTISKHRGQPILDNVTLFPITPRSPSAPEAISSARVAGAEGGRLDAAQVQVRNATILDTINVQGDWFIRLDDGSGPADVALPTKLAFSTLRLVPGAVIHAAGVLVPGSSEGSWWLRPRSLADFTVVSETSPLRPTAPSTVSARPAGETALRISWKDNSSNETGFRIERSMAPAGPWTEVATVDANVTDYTDSGRDVVANSTYLYRVQACNGKICSSYSEIATGNTVPAAPAQLTAATGLQSIALSWRDNSVAETEFHVERKTGVDGTYARVFTLSPNTTYHVDTGVAVNVNYVYRVRACNEAGCSAYSNEAVGVSRP